MKNTAQKNEVFHKGFLQKCEQIRRKMVAFTEEILNGKLHFLCSERDFLTQNNSEISQHCELLLTLLQK